MKPSILSTIRKARRSWMPSMLALIFTLMWEYGGVVTYDVALRNSSIKRVAANTQL